MKLTDTYSKTMKEILDECEIVDQKIHTDDHGNIQSIELKYKPKDRIGKNERDGRALGGRFA